MEVFSNDEFKYVDLLMPDPTRTKYFILQLINFYRFKCDRLVEVEQVANELVIFFYLIYVLNTKKIEKLRSSMRLIL